MILPDNLTILFLLFKDETEALKWKPSEKLWNCIIYDKWFFDPQSTRKWKDDFGWRTLLREGNVDKKR